MVFKQNCDICWGYITIDVSERYKKLICHLTEKNKYVSFGLHWIFSPYCKSWGAQDHQPAEFVKVRGHFFSKDKWNSFLQLRKQAKSPSTSAITQTFSSLPAKPCLLPASEVPSKVNTVQQGLTVHSSFHKHVLFCLTPLEHLLTVACSFQPFPAGRLTPSGLQYPYSGHTQKISQSLWILSPKWGLNNPGKTAQISPELSTLNGWESLSTQPRKHNPNNGDTYFPSGDPSLVSCTIQSTFVYVGRTTCSVMLVQF